MHFLFPIPSRECRAAASRLNSDTAHLLLKRSRHHRLPDLFTISLFPTRTSLKNKRPGLLPACDRSVVESSQSKREKHRGCLHCSPVSFSADIGFFSSFDASVLDASRINNPHLHSGLPHPGFPSALHLHIPSFPQHIVSFLSSLISLNLY